MKKIKANNIAKATDQRVTVRFPTKTRQAIKKIAATNGRSFNSEVITRLNSSLQE